MRAMRKSPAAVIVALTALGGANATETYILMANTSSTAGVARVTITFEDGSPQVTRDFSIAANSRANVAVAIDFPDMQIVMAHPSFPWQDEALSVATHKPNVWIDLSGWSPKYFPRQLVQYANTLLKDRILFGSDYPLITPERWMKDFEEAGFRPEVMPGILKGNAVRLLGLA